MKLTQRLLALGLCAALLLPLCACRHSDVLEQIIYDMMRDEIDWDAPFEPEDNDLENEDTSDELKELDKDNEDAERSRDENPELSQQTEEDEDGGQSVNLEYNPESEQDGQASVGETVVTEPDPDPDPDDSEQTTPDEEEEGSGEEDGGAGDEGVSYEGENGARTMKQVVDAYGNTVEVPEDVDKVTATGELAVMVMMLDSADRLAASNTGLTGNSMAARVFSGLSGVSGLWSGSGTSSLSSDNFQALLNLAPDVVLETSGSGTLSDSQIAALKENGISYLVLPQPTSAANIGTIMTTLGTVLGDKSDEGGANAPQNAANYIAWVNDVTGKVSQATASQEGMYTLYVDGWDDEAYYRLADGSGNVSREGYGCAFVSNSRTISCQTLTSYLGTAHVTNTAYAVGSAISRTQYLTPLYSPTYVLTMTVEGPNASVAYADGQKLANGLGASNFPILLVADQRTKQAIETDRDSGEGLWTTYGETLSGTGSFEASNGYTDGMGNLVCTQISGDYEVVVNPSGVSSWVGGSAESVLESVWAAWRFQNAISESDLRAYVSDYYSQFYGYTLSASELDSILEGQ